MIDFRLVDSESECSICSLNKMLEKDHVESRAQAPHRVKDKTNLWTLCKNCHLKKTDNIWQVNMVDKSVNGEAEVQMVEVGTGRVVWRRVIPPKNFDASEYINSYNILETGLMNLRHGVKYLSNSQLVDAFIVAGKIGEWSWKIQAELLYEAKLRMNWGSVGENLLALGKTFGISRSQIYNYLKIFEEFKDSELWEAPEEIPMSAFLLASGTPKPEEALNYFLDTKAQDPRYNTTDFKAEIEKARTDVRGAAPECPSCHEELQCRYCHVHIEARRIASAYAIDKGRELTSA